MSKHKTIKVVSVPTGKQAFIKEISTGLESLQAEVGGYIQALYPYEDEVALICNDEGKLMNLPLNRALKLNGMAGNEIYDIIAGDFFICYAPYTSENFESIEAFSVVISSFSELFSNFFKKITCRRKISLAGFLQNEIAHALHSVYSL